MFPKITITGGGGGLGATLRGIREYSSNTYAIGNMTDSGGNAGWWRKLYPDLPAPGDLKPALYELAGPKASWRDIMNIRSADTNKMSLGNALIMELMRHHGVADGVRIANEMMDIDGYRVIPITTDASHVHFLTDSNTILKFEDTVDTQSLVNPQIISSTFLEPTAYVFRHAAETFASSDLVVFAPGSPLTSHMPNLRVNGVKDSILKARKIALVINLSQSARERVGKEKFWGKASAFAELYFKALGGNRPFDAIICNDDFSHMKTSVLNSRNDHDTPIEIDKERLSEFCRRNGIITGSFSELRKDVKHGDDIWVHNKAAGRAIMSCL